MTLTVDSLDAVLATRIPRGRYRGETLEFVAQHDDGQRWLSWALALEPGAFEDDDFEQALEALARVWPIGGLA